MFHVHGEGNWAASPGLIQLLGPVCHCETQIGREQEVREEKERGGEDRPQRGWGEGLSPT